MHQSVLTWVPSVLTAAELKGKSVLEVGAADVNGSIRPVLEQRAKSYLGVDAGEGDRVDEVVDATGLVKRFGRDAFDVVVSCEMLEHAEDWRRCLHEMAAVTSDWLVVTTRSKGMPYHAFPDDFWRFSVKQLTDAVEALRFEVVVAEKDPQYQHPGVFLAARKPEKWRRPKLAVLDDITPSEVKP